MIYKPFKYKIKKVVLDLNKLYSFYKACQRKDIEFFKNGKLNIDGIFLKEIILDESLPIFENKSYQIRSSDFYNNSLEFVEELSKIMIDGKLKLYFTVWNNRWAFKIYPNKIIHLIDGWEETDKLTTNYMIFNSKS